MKLSKMYFTSHQQLLLTPPFNLISQNGFQNCCKFHNKNVPNFHFLVRISSSSSSLGGYGSDFPEKLIDEEMKKKKKKRSKIAGIDQDELLDPRQLADPDSCFCEFKGVHIHYKVCEPEPSISEEQKDSQINNPIGNLGFPMILLHGFGASSFSWHRVMKPFAQITGSKVLAFDRPAFGLTSRVSQSRPRDDTMPPNPYFMAFSVMATLYFIDFLKSQKAVLVGHSAGSLTAVETYFEAPDRVSALILVAPAIVAPLSSKPEKSNQLERESQAQESNSTLNQHSNLLVRFGQFFSKFSRYIADTIMQLLKGMMNMVSSLYQKVVVAILRSALSITLVRMIIDKFGIAAVRNAWYDANQVTDYILDGYTKPLRTKDWDKALVEYTVSMLTDPQTKLKPPLEKRLQDISCPVLIVTGDNDRLVPSWNSERLSRAIPGSELKIIEKCGHLPHEERPDEFISVVANFLQRVFDGSKELCVQT